jgi:acetyl-CoA carboxylase carboxyl transferase subunit beta
MESSANEGVEWFKRTKEGILTPHEEKMEVPDGLWTQCPDCKKPIHHTPLEENHFVCPNCSYHFKVGSDEYFNILFGKGLYTFLDEDLESADPLVFKDTKNYPDRLKETIRKTGLKDAIRVAHGKLEEVSLVVACMDFRFIGGSMGSVMGEKIARAVDYACENKMALLVISRSGGARMMEGAYSLMQMAKVSARLTRLAKAGLPYISLLTDPTTGGVTASFAMLGDFNISEPHALIGFAGPRVIKETIGKDLPEGFQTAEFVKEHGFLDFIVDRNKLREKLHQLLTMVMH